MAFAALSRIRILVFICVGAFLLAAGAIVVTGLNDRVANADMIVVPGNAVAPDGRPSPRLQARLDAALKVFRERRAPLVFVSGGTGKEGYDEAVTMSDYLIRNGVPPAAIVKDSFGIDTAATARNAGVFMKSKNLKSAIVATQYFHVARTSLALERNGVHVAGTIYARYFEVRDLYSIVRETFGYAVYALAR
jgi:vancomycin permeability regulator SanA